MLYNTINEIIVLNLKHGIFENELDQMDIIEQLEEQLADLSD